MGALDEVMLRLTLPLEERALVPDRVLVLERDKDLLRLGLRD